MAYFDGGKAYVCCEDDKMVFRSPIRWKIQLGILMLLSAPFMAAGLWLMLIPPSFSTTDASSAWAGVVISLLGLGAWVWIFLSEANPAELEIGLRHGTYQVSRGIFPFIFKSSGPLNDIKGIRVITRYVRNSNERVDFLLLDWKSWWNAPIVLATSLSNPSIEFMAHLFIEKLGLSSEAK